MNFEDEIAKGRKEPGGVVEMKKAALKDVAPAKAARVTFSPKDAVWQLNLDQVESQSGRILSKVIGLASAAGSSTQAFDTGNVLYSKLRPYLNKVVCPDTPGIATTELVPLRPDPKLLDRQYLTYYLRSPEFVTWISNEVAGAKMPRVTMKVFWDHEIPLPPLAEQKRIAAILDAADAMRAKRREALAQLDALLQSTFLTLFGDPVANPMRWPELEFEQIVTSTKLGLVRDSTEFGWEMPVPYVRMDAITNDGCFLPEKVQRTNATKAEIDAYGLRSGDFLLNTRNSKELVGKIAVFRGPLGWTFNNNIIRIRFRKDIEPDVISTQFRFSRVQQALEQRKAGTTSVFAIYWKELKTLPVLVPPASPPTKIRRHRRIHRAPEDHAARPPRRAGRPLRRPPAPRLPRGTVASCTATLASNS